MDCHINTPCITCGKLIRKSRTGLCVDCYNKSQQKNISRCKICLKRIRNDSSTGLCLEHYKLIKPPYKRKPTIIIKKSHNKQTRCNKCGKQIRHAGLCSTCTYLERAKRQIEIKKKQAERTFTPNTHADKLSKNYNPSPCLKGVSTAEEQIYIACQKGGIDHEREKIFIYKFSVEKYEEKQTEEA